MPKQNAVLHDFIAREEKLHSPDVNETASHLNNLFSNF